MPNELTDRLFYTGIAILAAILIGFAVYLWMKPRGDSRRRRKRLRYRIIYLAAILILVVISKLWITNFQHFFTALGLVAAGLVVANKETIMNFIGFFIINWRNLFAEGDHILLLTYTGYVDSLGPLYFKMYEVDPDSNCLTGRTIRVPNGLVINNSVLNYSASNQLLQVSVNVPLKLGTNLMGAQNATLDVINEILLEHYHKLPLPEALLWRRYHKHLAYLVAEEPVVRWQPVLDKQTVSLVVYFYCLSIDQLKLKNAFWQRLLLRSQENDALKLALGGGD